MERGRRGWEDKWSGDLKGWDLRLRKERGGWVCGLGVEMEEERKERWVVVRREAEEAAIMTGDRELGGAESLRVESRAKAKANLN